MPPLSSAQEEFPCELIFEKDEELIPALPAFETNVRVIFSRVALKNSMTKLFPAKYWEYVGDVAGKEYVEKNCGLMLVFA